MLKPGNLSPLVLLASNTDWSIANFRSGLIRRLKAEGYSVAAVAPDSGKGIGLPCELIPVEVHRIASPLHDLRLLRQLAAIFRTWHPFAILTFTPKMNVWGALAASRSSARLISNVSGLGSGFLGGSLLMRVMHALYRRANRRADWVFFQNEDDLGYFTERRLVNPHKAILVPGSGVDLSRFRPEKSEPGREFAFLLIARLLKDKGVYEYVEAARLVSQRHAGVRFRVVGYLDSGNPSAIPERQLREWIEEGAVEHLAWRDDVRPLIANADCVVLPSYREGMSRTLLEAAAMARPVIATDVPGCRQVVEHERTGYLCRVRDAKDLAAKMLQMIELPASDRMRMGASAREKVEREYDENIVIERYLQALRDFKPPGMNR